MSPQHNCKLATPENERFLVPAAAWLNPLTSDTFFFKPPHRVCCALTLQAPEEVPSGRAEVSELQLMADNHSSLEVTAEQEHSTRLPHAGSQRRNSQRRRGAKHIGCFKNVFILHHATAKKKKCFSFKIRRLHNTGYR